MSKLAEMVEAKRKEVEARSRKVPKERLRAELQPTERSLMAALSLPGPRFILECKRRAPSRGTLREGLSADAIAEHYAGRADAISVLTDGPYFGGSYEDLARIRARVRQPVLCKDIVVDPYQVLEARSHGADAVLLMLSVLDDEDYLRCLEVCRPLGMEALTEVHTEDELCRALLLGADLIAINNRDLHTLRVDLETSRRLAPGIPPGPIVVSASGIAGREDVDAAPGRIDAFLVGSHLMQAERIDLAASELLFGRVKVCGLRSSEQVRLAYESGASYAGLIFAEASPRRIDLAQARAIAEASPLPLVGVFVDERPEVVAAHADTLRLSAVQIHGDTDLAELRRSLPRGCEIWQALPVRDALPEIRESPADKVLLDSHHPTLHGGSGRRFDWTLLEALPREARKRVVLAGGIDQATARRARALGCHAIDVNSGVERSPGEKDPERLRRFFSALRKRDTDDV